MKKLSGIVHPDKGVRFSPYAFVDVEKDLIFSRTRILNFFKDQIVYNWGVYDGIGTPINLTPVCRRQDSRQLCWRAAD